MKGVLRKIDNKWMVQYIGHPIDVLGGNHSLVNYVPLHPDDVKQIEEDSKVFDDIESRIRAYPNVDFVFYDVWKEVDGYTHITTHAKLIKKNVVDELATKELMGHLIDENGEFRTTTISTDDKKAWWKKGYEKAKETLYTEEQMKSCWNVVMSYRAGFSNSITYEEFIQSLKQTKNEIQ
jgi:hypothetical protein